MSWARWDGVAAAGALGRPSLKAVLHALQRTVRPAYTAATWYDRPHPGHRPAIFAGLGASPMTAQPFRFWKTKTVRPMEIWSP